MNCTACGKDTHTEEHGTYEWNVGDGTGAVLCSDCVSLPEWIECPVCHVRGCDDFHEKNNEIKKEKI
jgi:hypothetical protein